MIQMRSMLWEITLGGVTPYATQFVWYQHGENFEADITADGQPIQFVFTRAHRNDWVFAMVAPDRVDPGKWTVSHDKSAATGQVNYLRLMRTAADAIRDFAEEHRPEAIDVTGSDTSSDAKDLQKTRIYKELLAANTAELDAIGYRMRWNMGKLWLIRKQDFDATGIQDKLDMSQVKIKRAVVNGLLVFIPHYNGERMGAFRLRPVAGGYRIKETVLYDRYRSQGVGKAMYRYMIRKLKEQGNRLYSDSYQSAEAAGVWDALVRDGVAVKLPDGTYAAAE